MKRLVQIVMVAALVLAAPVQAVRRYSCDFESPTSRNSWVLNPGGAASGISNKWYIGAPGNNSRTGQYGLYVSDDNGASAHYRNQGCWVFAYDSVTLDNISADYTLTFDYCVMANMSSNFDGLYLLWIPENDEDGNPIAINSIATSPGKVPTRYANYVIPLQPTANMAYLAGTVTWKECSVKIPAELVDGTKHYLAFAWTNGSRLPQQPAAMVDNILITDGEPCPQPTNLVVTPNGVSVSLSWQGTATEYEVSAYSYDSKSWAGPKIVTGNSTQFTALAIGQTDFIVRAKCDEGFYSLKTIVSQLIYYPEQMCVDYLNLQSAKCYVANSQPSDTRDFSDFRLVNAVDYGPESQDSRHTVHFDRTEYEPRTGNVAKTIPDGELASVRLGNWENETGEGAEQIEFSFKIDTIKYPVLLLKYMPIIEAPNHDDYENSRFTLDILVDGQTIGRCGQADFNANDAYNKSTQQLKPGASEQGWHLVPPGSFEGSTTPVVWKEWTTVGVNIKKYAGNGSTITARLATYDCIYNAHFGYAYFTLGCSDGKLKGMKCGEINETFEAPDGFKYRWAYASDEVYRRPDRSLPEQYVKGRNQKYQAGRHDDHLYVVDCMFVQDTTCFFSLYASTLATNPISVIDHKVIRNCQEGTYKVQFDGSKSWVQEIDHVTEDTLKSKAYRIEHYEWMVEGLPDPYNWSDDTIHTFDFPIEGGDYTVKLITTCGTCTDTAVYQLHLDPLGPTHETQTIVLCDADRKAGYKWAERSDTLHYDYGLVDSIKLFNEVSSCDSFIYLELVEPIRILEDTMILPEDLPYTRHGKTYPVGTVSHVDTIPFPTTCDTTWVFNLEVYESLVVEPATSYVLCEGADTLTFVYDVKRGRSQSFLYGFTNQDLDTLINYEQKKGHYEVPLVLDPNMEPGLYNGAFKFTDLKPEFSVNVPFAFTMNYAPFVIAQRWNDVLAIRNDTTIRNEYEAMWGYKPVYHYEFDSVQWFVSGLPIDSANNFNYYAGEKQQLQFGKEYQALLRRVKDGALVFTCAYIPQPVPTTYTEQPHLIAYTAKPKQALRMRGRGTAEWYDMLGRRHHVDGFNDSDILAPATVGYYLLVLQREDGREINQVLVK